MRYVLGIGTNVGDRKENIDKAIKAIELLPQTKIVLKSSIYETQPVGYDEQQDFYNICVEVQSIFNPYEMIGAVLGIEAGFGRVRSIKNGPRIIDIDIIFAENIVIETRNLTTPHPRYKERRFVLEPLMELYPDGHFYGYSFYGLSEKIKNQAIKDGSIPVLFFLEKLNFNSKISLLYIYLFCKQYYCTKVQRR